VRHVRMLGLCLVAVFAVCAYAVSSAFAGPQWVKCEAKAGGNYKNANCTEKAKPKGTGSYELLNATQVGNKRVAEGKSKNVPFTGENVGSGGALYSNFQICQEEKKSPLEEEKDISGRFTREACAKHGNGSPTPSETIAVECEREASSGEAVGTSSVANVSVTFFGCKAFGVIPCSNTSNEQEIQVNKLIGKLGYINKAETKVGVLLEPAAKKHPFAEFDCGGFLGIVVGVGNKKEGSFYPSSGCYGACPGTTPEEEKHGGYDGIISPIAPVNTMTSEYTQVYKINHTTVENIPNKFEGKHIDLLEDYDYVISEPTNGGMWSPAGEEITNVNHSEEPSEIKA